LDPALLKREATGGRSHEERNPGTLREEQRLPLAKTNTNANSNKEMGIKQSYNTRNHENPWISGQSAGQSFFPVFAQNEKQSEEIATAAPTGAHRLTKIN